MRPYGLLIAIVTLLSQQGLASTKTWDGRYSTARIELSVVYFVPSDRKPLDDWRDRVDYYCRRIEKFHAREFGIQSKLITKVIESPFISSQTTAELRQGDANSIFFKTLSETDRGISFQTKKQENAFSILLVLSEINWRPLDDFYRLHPNQDGLEFEGNYQRGEHFPGAASGGARASYLAERGCGWGLVSADGWRVPYRGSDCVVYHEGCGHTVGLPHPDQANGSVMSLGQYRGWLSESWIDPKQKEKLKWKPETTAEPKTNDLFSVFRAIPQPIVPKPNQPITLNLHWPEKARVKNLRVRYQTSIHGPWSEVPYSLTETLPDKVYLGHFDRPTPVSYRLEAELESGESEELWGYFQVREDPSVPPSPAPPSMDLQIARAKPETSLQSVEKLKSIDLLRQITKKDFWTTGNWTKAEQTLISPKTYGARYELPVVESESYRLQLLVEPLDPPNALLIGHRLGSQRFATLFGFATKEGFKSAIENIDGRNVGNETTYSGSLFRINQLSQVIIQVTPKRVVMVVDGIQIVDWKGEPEQLSLSDYWKTPNPKSLFLGTYDCRFKFHQVLLTPL